MGVKCLLLVPVDSINFQRFALYKLDGSFEDSINTTFGAGHRIEDIVDNVVDFIEFCILDKTL